MHGAVVRNGGAAGTGEGATNPPATLPPPGFALPIFWPNASALLPSLVPFLDAGADWSGGAAGTFLCGLLLSLTNADYSSNQVGCSGAAGPAFAPAPSAGFSLLRLGRSRNGATLAGFANGSTFVQHASYDLQSGGPAASVYSLQPASAGDFMTATATTAPVAMQSAAGPYSSTYFAQPAWNAFSARANTPPPWPLATSSPVALADVRSYRDASRVPSSSPGAPNRAERTLLLSAEGRVSSPPSVFDQTESGNANFGSGGPWVAARAMPWPHAKLRFWNTAPDYLALARGAGSHLCLLTKALGVECYSVVGGVAGGAWAGDLGAGTAVRSDGPWVPSAPLAPVLALVGLRGRDEVCAHVPSSRTTGRTPSPCSSSACAASGSRRLSTT